MGRHVFLFLKQQTLVKTLGVLLFLLYPKLAIAENSAQIASAACALNQPVCEYYASSTQLLSATNPQYFVLDDEDDVILKKLGEMYAYI